MWKMTGSDRLKKCKIKDVVELGTFQKTARHVVIRIQIFHKPPEGDRREVVLYCEIDGAEGSVQP